MDIFSVIILCYRNFEYLHEAIDSVLSQTYPAVELIVSDDCSPDFPRQELEDYIAAHRKAGLCRFMVRREEQNCGTVKHVNHAIRASSGRYVILMAADDAFYSPRAIEQYAQGFRKAPPDCCLLVAQTAMCDQSLQGFEEYYLNPTVQKILEEQDHAALFDRLSYSACLPTTSTCYARRMFDEYGFFDEDCKLIEDYPMHLKIAREGLPFFYENFIANRHRSGGISHGAQKALSSSKRQYFRDILYCHNMVLKMRKGDSTRFGKLLRDEYRHQKIWLDYQILWRAPGLAGKLRLGLTHPVYSLQTCLKKAGAIPLRSTALLLAACFFAMVGLPFVEQVFEILWDISLQPILSVMRVLLQVAGAALIVLTALSLVGTAIRRIEWQPDLN